MVAVVRNVNKYEQEIELKRMLTVNLLFAY